MASRVTGFEWLLELKHMEKKVIIRRSFCTVMQHFKCVKGYDTFFGDDWPNSKSMLTILDKF